MSVKKELDNFFARFLERFQETTDGLPRTPRRKDIDQEVYVGEPNADGVSGNQYLMGRRAPL